eukprot:3430996-Pyramimonas_sp.AAC.1
MHCGRLAGRGLRVSWAEIAQKLRCFLASVLLGFMLTLYWSNRDSANLGPEQRRVWQGDRAHIVADRAHVGVRDGGAVWR